MSNHGQKRGRPSLGQPSPPSKRPNTSSSSTSASETAPRSTAGTSRYSAPSRDAQENDDYNLPGPVTQHRSLSLYDKASIYIPDSLKSLWSFLDTRPVPKSAFPSPPKKRRRNKHRLPEMKEVDSLDRRPAATPVLLESSTHSRPPPTPSSSIPPGDWRSVQSQIYAASIPLPPSPPRARAWLPSASSSASSQPSPQIQQRNQVFLSTPLRPSTSRVSKSTPGSNGKSKIAGGGRGSEGQSKKERLRILKAKEFMMQEARKKFREVKAKEEERIGHKLGADAGADEASMADLVAKLVHVDSERERKSNEKGSTLLQDIKSAGKPSREAPEDWFKKLQITEAKAQLSRRPPPPHLPSYNELLGEDALKDKKIAERIAALQVEKLPDDLTPEQKREVDALLSDRSRINICNKITVKYPDLILLRPRTWLNDEVMNYYCAMIKEAADARLALADKWGKERNLDPIKARRQWVGPKGELALDIHAFSTFFFAKLEEPNVGYEKGRLNRWTKKLDIFKKDLILVPINQGNSHWSCAVINFRCKRIEAYDSMDRAGGANFVFKHLRNYLQLESKDKKKDDFDFEGWENYADHHITPQQLNGYDCGVFSCHFLEATSIGGGFGTWSFGQENMPYLRKRMMLEIGRVRLLNHPESKP